MALRVPTSQGLLAGEGSSFNSVFWCFALTLQVDKVKVMEIGFMPKQTLLCDLDNGSSKAGLKICTQWIFIRFRFTQGDLQPDCLADQPVTGPRQST
eukprot:388828-Pelagomonas_calceolata.AAC.1